MVNKNWIINVRCTCEAEYIELQEIHKRYREEKRCAKKSRGKKTGDIIIEDYNNDEVCYAEGGLDD